MGVGGWAPGLPHFNHWETDCRSVSAIAWIVESSWKFCGKRNPASLQYTHVSLAVFADKFTHSDNNNQSTYATRNKSITSKAMQYRQDCQDSHTNAHYAGGVNISIENIWHNSAADFFCVLVNFRRKFANLVAPPIDITTKRLVHCKSYPVL